MNTYICTATFTDTRIKPRTAVVSTTGTRKDARRQGRKEILAAIDGRGWEIAQVTATVDSKVVEAPAKVVATAKAKSTRTRKPADPAKKAAALVADAIDPDHGAAWWVTYRATRADQRKGVVVEAVGGNRLVLVPAN